MARTSDIINFILSGAKVEANAHVLCLHSFLSHVHYMSLNGIYLGLMSLIVVTDVAYQTMFWKYKIVAILVSWLAYTLAVRETYKYYHSVMANTSSFIANAGSGTTIPTNSLPNVMTSLLSLQVAADVMGVTVLTGDIKKLHMKTKRVMYFIYAMFIVHALAVILMFQFGGK